MLAQGRLDEAQKEFAALVAREPANAEAHYRLGYVLGLQGSLDEARRHCEHALALAPSHVDAICNRGFILLRQGNAEEAMACYRQALALQPGHVKAEYNLAIVLLKQNRIPEAAAGLRRALALQPELVEARFHLGNALVALGHMDEAAACFRAVIAQRPDHAEAWVNLGNVLVDGGRLDEAVDCLRQAAALRPDVAEAHYNFGIALLKQDRPREAEEAFRRALVLRQDYVEAHYSVGLSLVKQGRAAEGIVAFDAALALRPDFPEAHSNRLLSLLYVSGITPQRLGQEHRRCGEYYEAPFRAHWPRHANGRDPERRLKVGYVSADLRRHSVAYFLEPLWARHDRRQLEVYAYFNARRGDDMTARLRTLVDHWRECCDWTDADFAERLRADGIDILVDLSGHTAGNRLPLFARRPAPVQVSYLGYAATSGLTAMDWRLTSAEVDPPGAEEGYSERLYRLPRTLWCYRPRDELAATGAEAEMPAPRCAGEVVFGALNNLAKASAETISAWCALLRRVPASRLVLTTVPEGALREDLRARFAAGGVAVDRVALHGRLAAAEYRALLRQVDIALDPFPYNGTTTTCDALWCGIPVVSLSGNGAAARSGHALLKTVGLEALVAADVGQYIETAAALAHDGRRRDELRRGLRARCERSALRDEDGFARDVEAAYRTMWRAWCDAHQHAESDE